MNNCIRTIVVLFSSCLPLAGCSMFHSHPAPSVATNDIPAADRLDAKHSQTLFLAVVAGLRGQGQSQAALAYLDQFERQYPGVPYATLLRAQCLMDVGKAGEAEPVFNTILKGDYAAAAHAGLGSIAASRGDWSHAAGDFEEAARLEPAAAQYANDLGFARVKLGDYGNGVDMLGRASQLAPDNRFIRNNLILGLHLSGKNQEAAQLIDTIAEPSERQKAQKLLLVSADTVAAPVAHQPADAISKSGTSSKIKEIKS